MNALVSRTAAWCRSVIGVIGIATALMGVVLWDNTAAPWAPFHIAYAALATGIALAVGTVSFAPARPGRPSIVWAAAALGPLALQTGARLLPGVETFPAALEALFGAAGARWAVEPLQIQTAYLTFVVLWAGLGEELFYRGYMHGNLRSRVGVVPAALISAAWFAARHPIQLSLLWPDYPWGAAGFWMLFSFLAGLFLSWLYERTGSLRAPILAHYLLNTIPFVVAVLLAPAD